MTLRRRDTLGAPKDLRTSIALRRDRDCDRLCDCCRLPLGHRPATRLRADGRVFHDVCLRWLRRVR